LYPSQGITNFFSNTRAAHWADHRWNAKWLDNPTRLRTFIPDTWNDPPSWHGPSKNSMGPVGLTASAPVSGVSDPTYTNGVWLPLRPVSVAYKNKPSTMLSSNVQFIDLPMDCMA